MGELFNKSMQELLAANIKKEIIYEKPKNYFSITNRMTSPERGVVIHTERAELRVKQIIIYGEIVDFEILPMADYRKNGSEKIRRYINHPYNNKTYALDPAQDSVLIVICDMSKSGRYQFCLECLGSGMTEYAGIPFNCPDCNGDGFIDLINT